MSIRFPSALYHQPPYPHTRTLSRAAPSSTATTTPFQNPPALQQHFWVSCRAFAQLRALPTPLSERICVPRGSIVAVFFFFWAGGGSATSISFSASAVRPFCACHWIRRACHRVRATACARVISLLSSGIAGFRAVLSVDSVVSSGPAPPPHPLHPRPQRRGMEVMRCDGRGRFLAGYYPMSQSQRAWRGQCKGIAGGPGSQNTRSQTFSFCLVFFPERGGIANMPLTNNTGGNITFSEVARRQSPC